MMQFSTCVCDNHCVCSTVIGQPWCQEDVLMCLLCNCSALEMPILREAVLMGCPCSDARSGSQSCMSHFSVGQLVDLRESRAKMKYQEEKLDRSNQIKAAIAAAALGQDGSTHLAKPRMVVLGVSVCIEAWVQIYAFPTTSGTNAINRAYACIVSHCMLK